MHQEMGETHGGTKWNVYTEAHAKYARFCEGQLKPTRIDIFFKIEEAGPLRVAQNPQISKQHDFSMEIR